METEVSTKVVDQEQALAEKIAKIIEKVHRSVGVQPSEDWFIESDVAYRYIEHLENRGLFRNELMNCEKRKWADFLTLIPHARRSVKQFLSIITELDAFLTKPLLEI